MPTTTTLASIDLYRMSFAFDQLADRPDCSNWSSDSSVSSYRSEPSSPHLQNEERPDNVIYSDPIK
jgi:hypothetical protein